MARTNNNESRDKFYFNGGRIVSVGVILFVLIMSAFGGAFHVQKTYDVNGNVVSYTVGIIDHQEHRGFFEEIE